MFYRDFSPNNLLKLFQKVLHPLVPIFEQPLHEPRKSQKPTLELRNLVKLNFHFLGKTCKIQNSRDMNVLLVEYRTTKQNHHYEQSPSNIFPFKKLSNQVSLGRKGGCVFPMSELSQYCPMRNLGQMAIGKAHFSLDHHDSPTCVSLWRQVNAYSIGNFSFGGLFFQVQISF